MNKKIAFITGTSSGFGLLTTLALAHAGYHVIATMRDTGKKTRLLQEAEKAGVPESAIEVLALDVTDEQAVTQVAADVLARHGHIDVLVNNAGYAAGGFIEDVPMEAWRAQFETNVFGLMAVTKAFLPAMRARRQGKIIMISSISGRVGLPAMGPYCASKFAVEGFSEALRLELLSFGIDVVLIEPASYKTDIWDKGLSGMEPDPASAYYDLMQGMYRMARNAGDNGGDPQEVVDVILRTIQDPAPKLRYPVGKGLKQMLFLRSFLPGKLFENAVSKRLKKGKR